MTRLFVYGTLKNKKTVQKVLHHAVHETPAYVRGFRLLNHAEWPTIEPESGHIVDGDIFQVKKEDLQKLDDWEDHYRREILDTNHGLAWVYRRI